MLLENAIYEGSNGKKNLFDLEIPHHFNGKLFLFIHGYMGFKDWGCWNMMQSYFVERNFGFCKYNVSHNGVSVSNPLEFVDLCSFSINTYQKELEDLQCILDVLSNKLEANTEIYLIGHSRGGGIALLGAMDARISGIITLAAISSVEKRFPKGEALEKWRKEKIRYITNGRTKQEMPHSFEQYLNYLDFEEELNIQNKCVILNKPVFSIHGSADSSVNVEEGRQITSWLRKELLVIEGADHTFGAAHPWHEEKMPDHLLQVCQSIHKFIHFSKQ